jgi:hypothetical protein
MLHSHTNLICASDLLCLHRPSAGPHGFGGTYKKGEKGGHRPAHDDEHIPLAERGLARKGAPGAGAAAAGARKPATAAATAPQKGGTTAIKSKIRDLTRLLKKKVCGLTTDWADAANVCGDDAHSRATADCAGVSSFSRTLSVRRTSTP